MKANLPLLLLFCLVLLTACKKDNVTRKYLRNRCSYWRGHRRMVR